MKYLILILIPFFFASCSKEKCDGHFMTFQNTTSRPLSVRVDFDKDGQFEKLGTVNVNDTGTFQFPESGIVVIDFIYFGYKQEQIAVFVQPCENTFYPVFL